MGMNVSSLAEWMWEKKKILALALAAFVVAGLAQHQLAIHSLSSYLGGWETGVGIEGVEYQLWYFPTEDGSVQFKTRCPEETHIVTFQHWKADLDATDSGLPTFAISVNAPRWVDRNGNPTDKPVDMYKIQKNWTVYKDGKKIEMTQIDVYYLYLAEVQVSLTTMADHKTLTPGSINWWTAGTTYTDAKIASETPYYKRGASQNDWSMRKETDYNGRPLDSVIWLGIYAHPWEGRFRLANGTVLKPSETYAGIMSVMVPGANGRYNSYSGPFEGRTVVGKYKPPDSPDWVSLSQLPSSPDESDSTYGFTIYLSNPPGSVLPMQYTDNESTVGRLEWVRGKDWGPDPKIPSTVKAGLGCYVMPGFKPIYHIGTFGQPTYVKDIIPVDVEAKWTVVYEVLLKNTYGPLAVGVSYFLEDPVHHQQPGPTPQWAPEWIKNLWNNPFLWLGLGFFAFIALMGLAVLALLWFAGPPRRAE